MTEPVQSDFVSICAIMVINCLFFPELCAHLSSVVCGQFNHTMRYVYEDICRFHLDALLCFFLCSTK